MCRKCHSGLSNETVISQFKEELSNPKFEEWNTTSLHHLLIVLEGENGCEARDIALKLSEKFFWWYMVYGSCFQSTTDKELNHFPGLTILEK